MYRLLATAKLPMEQRRSHTHEHKRNNNEDTKVHLPNQYHKEKKSLIYFSGNKKYRKKKLT